MILSQKFAALCMMLTMAVSVPALAQKNGTIWLEGESAVVNVKPNIAGWGHTEFLSGKKWLHLSIDENKIETDHPAGGISLKWKLNAPQSANYEVWSRIGYEFVRSPFQWRIDSGAWKAVKPDDLTTDLIELAEWTEVAWLKMGTEKLAPGSHTLEINLARQKKKDGKWERTLFAIDALCLSPVPFVPNAGNKPGEGTTASDRQAASKVYLLPESKSAAARSEVALNGVWEICRGDEQLPLEVAAPMKGLPTNTVWKAIPVPADKNTVRPDLLMAHRVWYRTRISVPKTAEARSYHIVFPQNNLNTTVYANGVLCGFNKNPFAQFDIDVTKGIKPGINNEIVVGIRDAWYARSYNPKDPMKLRRTFNLPVRYFSEGFQELAYPIWHYPQSGILVTPTFVSAGAVRVSDVFCKPSVAKKTLSLEVTLSNPSKTPLSGEFICEAVNLKTGAVEKAFSAQKFTLAANAEQVYNAGGGWENPTLWWTDSPHLYKLRTTVKVGGKAIDTHEVTFGFREWGNVGKDFTLNGVVWHGWADLVQAENPQDWLKFYQNTNQKMMRFWGIEWQKLPPEQALNFFDAGGVVVRRSGMLDGQAIGNMAIENDPALRELYKSDIKMDLMQNWKDQILAQVKGERNHPSIGMWSLENEWLYINCINLYGDKMDLFEKEVSKVSNAVRALDPTRLNMTDGGGANKDQSMPIHGNHYVFDSNDTRYPDLAYSSNVEGGGRGRWMWDQKRPRFLGEDYFATGINPADYSIFGGEEVFLGKTYAYPAAGLIYRMLTEGYRWAEYGAWHFWLGQESATNQYGSNAPLAVFCRQWDWTFGSGQKVNRTYGIFNDTHTEAKVIFTARLVIDGMARSEVSETKTIGAGQNIKFDHSLDVPEVSKRTEGELFLSLSMESGKEIFVDSKAVSILPHAFPNRSGVRLTELKQERSDGIAIYDPKGGTSDFLKKQSVKFTPLNNLENLPENVKLLVIGQDALDERSASSSKLAAWASEGRAVLVLEQTHPLKYQAIPAEMETSAAQGRIAWGEDLSHPMLAGLKQKDFFTWGENVLVYRNAYLKPTRGAKSLVQCDSRLRNTALTEITVGKGVLMVCQLTVGENLERNAVAQKLLANGIAYGLGYQLEHRPVRVFADSSSMLGKTLDALGLQYEKSNSIAEALSGNGKRLAIVSATPVNLKMLASDLTKVDAFTKSGGYLILHGLTPEGLSDYNKLVGFDHMVRPFRRERVAFPRIKNPLTAGLSLGDIVLLSGERIFDFTSDEFVASDIYSYVVDLDDVAPFAQFENEFNQMMTNGFVSADAWKYIVNVNAPADPPLDFKLNFPKPQEIAGMEWVGNTFYYPVTKAQLIFDGKPEQTATVKTSPNNDPQLFTFDKPISGTNLILRLADWLKVPGKNSVTGLDNIRLFAKRPADFAQRVKPMLNVGGLVEYPRNGGGIILCNLLFKEIESVPLNKEKKKTILATVLRNLNAPFSGGIGVIVGTKLNYSPVDLSKQANQYRDERGWFGDKALTFKDLPTGRQTFGGVPFEIFSFPTSPVPTAIMLGGDGVPNNPAQEVKGIMVNRKADALFFLHSARIDSRRSNDELRDKKKYEMLRYVVNYADGQTVSIPIYAEIDVDDYRQKTPQSLPGAALAWSKPFADSDLNAAAWVKQWDNPRPEAAITSVDMLYGKERRGVPVLLALSAATQPNSNGSASR